MVNTELNINNLINTAKKDLSKYPYISRNKMIKSKLKNALNFIRGKQLTYIDRYSWPNAMIAISLENSYNKSKSEIEVNAIKSYIDGWICSGQKINNLDNTMNGYVLVFIFELQNDKKYKEIILKIVNYLYNHPKDRYGSLPYRLAQSDEIYVDAIGMICPFLCRYAKSFNDIAAVKLSIKQIENFMLYGIDKKSGLPYQGYNSTTKIKKGIIGWGRAVGWLLLGIIDSMQYLDKNEKEYLYLNNIYTKLVDIVITYQLPNGNFTWQLETAEGPIDTSSTSMILYSIKKGIILGVLSPVTYGINISQGKSAIKGSYKENNIINCSKECGGFGVYPQNYGSYPWGLAPTISFLSI